MLHAFTWDISKQEKQRTISQKHCCPSSARGRSGLTSGPCRYLYALAVELNILQRILVSHFDIPDEVYAELRRKARAEVAVSRKGAQIESVQAQMFGGDTGWQSSSQNGAI